MIVSAKVDGKPALWENGNVKTTFELPDDLIRRVKLHAIHEKQKLKDAVAFLLEKGMAHSSSNAVSLLPKPVALRKHKSVKARDIEGAIASGRV